MITAEDTKFIKIERIGRTAQGRAGCDEGGAGEPAPTILRIDKCLHIIPISDRDLFHGARVARSTTDCKRFEIAL